MEGQGTPVIVVDTNLLVYLVLPTHHSQVAESVWEKDDFWVAPELVFSEFRNVLLGAVRRGNIDRVDIPAILAQAREVIRVSTEPIKDESVIFLALEGDLSAYDAEFVWLSRQAGVPLVTSDRKERRSFPETTLTPEEFLKGKN